jgi:hypothetical protein
MGLNLIQNNFTPKKSQELLKKLDILCIILYIYNAQYDYNTQYAFSRRPISEEVEPWKQTSAPS